MNKREQIRFIELYERHLRMLKLGGMSHSTIDSYSRAVRRLAKHFDCCPDKVAPEQLEQYFATLIESHSWSTVKIDRNGLQFFWRNVLKQDWQWIKCVKPPTVKSLPDILTIQEVEKILSTVHKLRYRVALLTIYSMGLRLSEALSLQVGDIDSERKRVHIRRGKGHKDRFVPLPDLTLAALRALWLKHRNPRFIFPKPQASLEIISQATTTMRLYSVQSAMKAAVGECGIKKKFLCIPSDMPMPLTY